MASTSKPNEQCQGSSDNLRIRWTPRGVVTNATGSGHRPAGRLARSSHGVGDAPQEVLDDFELLGLKGVVHVLQMAFPAVPELPLHLPPLGGQVNTAGPSVVGMALALNQFLLLQPRQHLADGVGVGKGPLHHLPRSEERRVGKEVRTRLTRRS